MILPAQTIRKLQIITPFEERTKFEGMTYGLGPAGYDVRISHSTLIYPDNFALAATLEHFDMPNDVMAKVCDKSTWARQGLTVLNTVIEPGWRGYLTLELTNVTRKSILIPGGAPIAQIVFLRLEETTELPYDGKYQNQLAGPQPAILEK